MEWDYFVYSRGREQNDGIKLRHAPDYVTGDIITGCQAIFRFVKTKGESRAELSADRYEWNNTWVFLALKNFGCCLLARVSRIEDYVTGEPVCDFQKRQTWSLEGLCCPYEQAGYFFASLPSALLWLKQNEEHSLHTLMMTEGELRGRDKYEIPDNVVSDPEKDGKIAADPQFRAENPDFMKALDILAEMIYAAPAPFGFVFGTLARNVFEGVGKGYRLTKYIDTRDPGPGQIKDSFVIVPAEAAAEAAPAPMKTTRYELMIQFFPDFKKGGAYEWSVWELDNGRCREKVLSGDAVGFDMEQGVSVGELMAEAEYIRSLARRLGYEVEPFPARELERISAAGQGRFPAQELAKLYTFVKHE